MNHPRFTKVIIDYFMTRKPSISRRNRIHWHYVRDDALFLTIKVVSRHQATQQYGAILPIELTTNEIRNSEGIGSKPGVPDVSSDDSEEELLWKSSDDEEVGSQEEGNESNDDSDDGSDKDSEETVKSGADSEKESDEEEEQESRLSEEARIQEEEDAEKASARKKKGDSASFTTPPTLTPTTTIESAPRLSATAKGKQPSRATTPVEPTDVQRTEAEQLKIVLKRSRQETHISQQSGSGTDEGTGSKPGVPDVPSNDSEEELSWKSSNDEDDLRLSEEARIQEKKTQTNCIERQFRYRLTSSKIHFNEKMMNFF
nr:hypothetical protein [Tanacetum cinerariifolium]